MYYTMSSQSSPSSLSSSVQRGHCTLMPPALSPQKRPSQTKQNCTTQRGKNQEDAQKGKKKKKKRKRKKREKKEAPRDRPPATSPRRRPRFTPMLGSPPTYKRGPPINVSSIAPNNLTRPVGPKSRRNAPPTRGAFFAAEATNRTTKA